jgi:hypothetical protein
MPQILKAKFGLSGFDIALPPHFAPSFSTKHLHNGHFV